MAGTVTTIPHGVVSTHVWACDLNPERRGYLRMVRRLTIGEVFESLNDELGLGKDEFGMQELPRGLDEYFRLSIYLDESREWPDGRMIVYVVTGGSEGHYLHVDVVSTTHARVSESLFLGKTFAGWDAAWDAAKLIGKALGV